MGPGAPGRSPVRPLIPTPLVPRAVSDAKRSGRLAQQLSVPGSPTRPPWASLTRAHLATSTRARGRRSVPLNSPRAPPPRPAPAAVRPPVLGEVGESPRAPELGDAGALPAAGGAAAAQAGPGRVPAGTANLARVAPFPPRASRPARTSRKLRGAAAQLAHPLPAAVPAARPGRGRVGCGPRWSCSRAAGRRGPARRAVPAQSPAPAPSRAGAPGALASSFPAGVFWPRETPGLPWTGRKALMTLAPSQGTGDTPLLAGQVRGSASAHQTRPVPALSS